MTMQIWGLVGRSAAHSALLHTTCSKLFPAWRQSRANYNMIIGKKLGHVDKRWSPSEPRPKSCPLPTAVGLGACYQNGTMSVQPRPYMDRQVGVSFVADRRRGWGRMSCSDPATLVDAFGRSPATRRRVSALAPQRYGTSNIVATLIEPWRGHEATTREKVDLFLPWLRPSRTPTTVFQRGPCRYGASLITSIMLSESSEGNTANCILKLLLEWLGSGAG